MKNAVRFVFIFLIVILSSFFSFGQFNEKLATEIAYLNKRFKLDGIDRSEALNTLDAISSNILETKVLQLFPGETWKYSHTVTNTGRQYRSGSAMKKLDFSANGNAFFTKGKGDNVKTTYCKWSYTATEQLRLYHYDSQERAKKTRTDYLSIHSLSKDRLVIPKIIKSKEYPGKSAILFQVYFR
ncbi:hypothetical protein [Reichenbachiella versicolor]|uniref:hypothetical protein n=1 Tax=Reichenbachiella versicolor TaxID=1821036 RepID=UPI000D6E9B08|nr:hypothetical protein [Reichenbachiella versicolor]